MSCRLPGAADIGQFWELLKSGRDAVGEVPPDRWDVDWYFHPDPARPGRIYTKAGGFLDVIDRFDADFFGISPREARQMDPQQRILLELAWEALEHADIVPARLAGSDTGVFIGISNEDYGILQRNAAESITDPYGASGSALAVAANRISYVLDLHGPSLAIDTACSSALVAVHGACHSLWRGESSLAIAGGINILLAPETHGAFCKAAMLSPTGRCRAFAAEADGYVRSEGGGVVILKPLPAALADGNTIHAVILNAGVNSDGRTKGIALPNPVAQEQLLRQVYGSAGIDPADVSYVEAHGTGTSAGDRVECTALGRVFGATRGAEDPCLIGSVKTNIGHLEPASGIAGLLKATLTLEHRAIPPSLHAGNLNPKIPFDEFNLSVVREFTPLPERAEPLMVGVNSFGFGGTNAHLVLRSHVPVQPAPVPAAPEDSIEMLVLSARSEGALKTLAERYARRLREADCPALGTICRAVATHRSHHPLRIATFGESREEVAGRLEAFAAGYPAQMLAEGEASYQPSRIAFVFSGNGSQWVGMGRDLLAREPDFATCVGRIDAVLKPLVGWSVVEMLTSEAPATLFDKTEIAQPALFALQVGLVELLRRRGLTAEAMLGHSVGEVAAAHAAGALTLEQACLVVARRSQAQGRTAGAGKMAAVGLTEEQAAEAIAPYNGALEISAVNSPASVTVSGEASALAELAEALEAKGVFVRVLGLDYAFHSKTMAPLEDEIMAAFADLKPVAGEHRFISTVTGGERDGASLDAAYWWGNIRQPVRFGQAVKQLADDGIDVFLEIGPHPVLAGYLRECLQGADRTIFGTLRRSEPEREALWLALARCYAAGVTLDLAALFAGDGAPVALPAYPWQRERYWFDTSERMALPKLAKRQHPLLGYRAPTAEPTWQNSFDAVTVPFLRDHVVGGSVVFPAAGYIEMALAAAAAHLGTEAVEIEGLEIHRPLVFSEKSGQWLEFAIAEDNTFHIVTQQKAGPASPPLAVGRLAALADGPRPTGPAVEALQASLPLRISAEEHVARCAAHGLDYGPAFQGLREIWAADGEALGRIEAPAAIAAGLGAYHIHPAVLDACLQTAAGALQSAERAGDRSTFIPVRVERFRSLGGGDKIAWCHARVARAERAGVVVDFALLDAGGTAVAEVEGLRLRRIELTRASEIPTYHWDAEVQLNRWAAGGGADLPGPADCVAALAGESARLTRALGIEELRRELEPSLDRLAVGYAARALRALGAGEAPFSVHGLVQQARLAPESEPYLGALLVMLERRGAALRSGTEWRLRDDGGGEDPAVLWRRLVAEYPDHLASLELVGRCGERLEAILRGEADAESLLFSERDFNAGEQFEDSDPFTRLGNELAAGVMRHIRQHVAAGRALRVLEVGGGTGGLAAALLPELPAERVEYVFSDPREAAVTRAEGRFTDYPFVRYTTLDLDQEIASQGFTVAEFDVIVAANSLHECADLGRALARARDLLRPGGLLLLVEPAPSDFLEFVFGIRRRWWSFADLDLRAETPLMPPAQWEAALRAAAFTETAVLPRESAPVTV
ncbi:MAG TPA: beta-ketoacyl synthase N-terminal-like domain-containing protein, partial [Stellaceae bacterium]|nr:beta-ketoacyl synthase N-terminal-like domain-containing protein [Stellaceae bacterium]